MQTVHTVQTLLGRRRHPPGCPVAALPPPLIQIAAGRLLALPPRLYIALDPELFPLPVHSGRCPVRRRLAWYSQAGSLADRWPILMMAFGLVFSSPWSAPATSSTC